MKKYRCIYLFLFMITVEGVSPSARADNVSSSLPNEDKVSQGFKNAYQKLAKESPSPEQVKKVISEELSPALKEQGKALKNKGPEKIGKKGDVTPGGAVKKKSEKANESSRYTPASQNQAPILEDAAPEIDGSLFPGMIIYEKGKEAVEVPQDKRDMPGEIEFSGGKKRKGAFD
ncbi:MAG: hypothetical protein AABZ55_12875 [Bdellovibrionota bacterium]